MVFSFIRTPKILGYLLATVLFNCFAALLEGITFAMILMAFSSINQSNEAVNTMAFTKYLSSILVLSDASVYRKFVFFMAGAISSQVLRSFFSFLGTYFITQVTIHSRYKIEQKIYSQIFSLSYSQVSHFKIGDLVDYVSIPSRIIRDVFSQINHILLSVFMSVASLILLFLLIPQLTIVMLLLFGGLILFQRVFLIRRVARYSHDLMKEIVSVSKEGVQSLYAMKLIHIFHWQDTILSKIKNLLLNVSKVYKKLSLREAFIHAFNEIGAIVLVGVCFLLGAHFLHFNSAMLLPVLITYLSIIHRLSAKVQVFMGCISSLARHSGDISRVIEILSVIPESVAGEDKSGKHLAHFQSEIQFDQVCLRYPEQDSLALQDISFTLPKGNMIALVGPSGGGKTSTIDLLMGLYSPSRGNIRIDGKDLNQLDLESWRKMLGVVSQDTFIFNETIKKNIEFGRENVSFEEVYEASVAAGVDSFVQKLSQKYETIVGERGFRLSGGERQRIAIARALLRKPELLILDEATSSLDSKSERMIQQAVMKLHHEKTLIIIAHRLSTILHADQIYFIQGGRVVERGTHLELMKQGGLYAEYWLMQSKPMKITANSITEEVCDPQGA